MESERVELQKSLVDDIVKGMEQVKQLKVSSVAKSDQERMLASYEEALLILTGRAPQPQGQCHSVSSDPRKPPSRSSLKRKSRLHGPVKIITSEQDSDDGYIWRKYGQKAMLGSKFPRCYFRCEQKGQGCSALKYIQRSHIDPTKLEVTYYGGHTCQPGASAKTGIISPYMQSSHSSTSDT